MDLLGKEKLENYAELHPNTRSSIDDIELADAELIEGSNEFKIKPQNQRLWGFS